MKDYKKQIYNKIQQKANNRLVQKTTSKQYT